MLRQVYAACAALTVFSGAAFSQIAVTSVGGAPFVEAWVDPCNGNDILASAVFPPCENAPFQTINAAINFLSILAGPGSPGIVHCNPGIYAASTNGEQFPINMRNWVHLQGTGARQCVLRGEGASSMNVFYPESPNCSCGLYTSAEVLVNITNLYDSEEEMIDGFTFQGGDVQVYSRSEAECYARISNCVFDLLAHDETVLIYDEEQGGVVPNPLVGATFGILLVHDYHPNYAPDFYYRMPLNILNNTFIMAWLPGDDSQSVFSQRDAVAICDVNNPLCNLPPGMSDPNTRLRGIGPLNVQNNLIRTAPGQQATAMLGLDQTATTVRFGTPTGPSNAFDPALVGGFNATGRFCSAFNRLHGNGMPPRPRVNINPTTGGRDAAFIGEMLTRAFAQPLTVSRDWRILPSSALVDAGSMPNPLAAGGRLIAGNTTGYTEPTLVPLSSFDLDGEVYGNPRVHPAFGSTVLRADIGFDEAHLLVDCAGAANDSISHRWDPNVTPQICGPLNQGQPFRGLIFPVAGAFALFETRIPIPFPLLTPCAGGPAFYPAYTTMWGTTVPPFAFAGFAPFHDLSWMIFGLPTPGPAGNAVPVAYVAPNDPVVLNFAAGFAPVNAPFPWEFVNEQSLFVPTSSVVNFISNLQSSTD